MQAVYVRELAVGDRPLLSDWIGVVFVFLVARTQEHGGADANDATFFGAPAVSRRPPAGLHRHRGNRRVRGYAGSCQLELGNLLTLSPSDNWYSSSYP